MQEKRKASIAVWADNQLQQFAKKAVKSADTHIRENRFKTFLPDEIDQKSMDAMSEYEIPERDQTGILALKAPTLAQHVFSRLPFRTLIRLRRVSKSFLALMEGCSSSYSYVCLSPMSKTLDEALFSKVATMYGAYINYLDLRNCFSIVDSILLKNVDSFKNLTHLNMSSLWDMTDTGLTTIAEKLEFLKSIDLSNCKKITDTGVLALFDHAQDLTYINLGFCKMITAGMMGHNGWSRIQNASFQRCTGITDAGFLKWNSDEVGNAPCALSSLVFGLQDLNLADCTFLTDATLSAIVERCPNLKRLCLSFCCAMNNQLSSVLIEGCPVLEVLDVSYCGNAITDNSLLELSKGLPCLKTLGIRGCVQVTEIGIGYLKQYATQLSTINLTQCSQVKGEFVQSLGVEWKMVSTPVYSFSPQEQFRLYP